MTSKKVPEHEHNILSMDDKFIFIFIIMLLYTFIVGFIDAMTIDNDETIISSLEKNLTEMQDWFRENSETKILYKHIILDEPKGCTLYLCAHNINEPNPKPCHIPIDSCKIEYKDITYHVFKDTNISTERFFR